MDLTRDCFIVCVCYYFFRTYFRTPLNLISFKENGPLGIDLKDAVGSRCFSACRCVFVCQLAVLIFHAALYFLRVASTSRRKHFRTSGSYITYMIFTYIIYLYYATIYFTRLTITWPWHVILPCIHHDYHVKEIGCY